MSLALKFHQTFEKLIVQILANHPVETLSDSFMNSQSFRFGNRYAKQRAQMRSDFTDQLMPVLQDNFGQKLSDQKLDQQFDQCQTNLAQYLHAKTVERLNTVIDDDTWHLALKQLIKDSYTTRDLHADIVKLKRTMQVYQLQGEMIRACLAKYRSLKFQWAGIGIGITVIVLAGVSAITHLI